MVGSFSSWSQIRPLRKGKDGTWRTWIDLDRGQYEYRFLVDGSWTNDPVCRLRVPNPFGTENDVIEV